MESSGAKSSNILPGMINGMINEPPNSGSVLSEEQRLQLMQFMKELNEKRTSDPAAFQKTMETLGLVSTPGSSGVAGDQPEGNLVELANAIGQLRTSPGSDSSPITVNLPGGKSVLGQAGVENKQKGITITPVPGFTLKTKVVPSGFKVFINLCTHQDIEAPSVKKKLNAEGESVEGMNVPLSVGPQYHENDHAGVDCLVYDIILNPKVIQDSLEDLTGQYRDFLCHLSIQSVEQKYPTHGNLDRQYKLPKLKYMGATVRSQYVRDGKGAPKIQEISETIAAAPKTAEKKVLSPTQSGYLELDKDLPFRLSWIKSRNPNEDPSSAALADAESVGDFGCIKTSEFESPVLFPAKNIGTEYLEPLVPVEDDVIRVALFVDFSGTTDVKKIEVKVSAFRFQIKVPGYKALLLYLPCAVLPVRTTSQLSRPPGYVNRIEYCLSSEVDRTPWGDTYDAGSKPWLVAQALGGDFVDCVGIYGGDTGGSRVVAPGSIGNESDADFPEDRFHIKLPSNADQYTGVPRGDDVEMEDEFAEDSFHRKDAASSYLISQRAQAVKDKWAKHEKEKLERLNNPDSNIEYVDVDDYKPGGKHGPPLEPGTVMEVEEKEEAAREDLRKAAQLVASSFKDSEIGSLLSSNLWTELLD